MQPRDAAHAVLAKETATKWQAYCCHADLPIAHVRRVRMHL